MPYYLKIIKIKDIENQEMNMMIPTSLNIIILKILNLISCESEFGSHACSKIKY